MLKTFLSTVQVKEEIAPRVFRFVFALQNDTITFQSGHYILINAMGSYRQYSISSPPHETDFVETVVDVTPMGAGSRFLLNLQIGDTLSFRAPMGIFTLKKTEKPKVFLATGSGITPLKSMILELAHTKFARPYHLFWGLKTNEDIYFDEFFKGMQNDNPYFHYTYCLSREKNPLPHHIPGRIQNGLLKLSQQAGSLLEYEFYICGAGNMVDDVKTMLLNELNIPAANVFHEKFTLPKKP